MAAEVTLTNDKRPPATDRAAHFGIVATLGTETVTLQWIFSGVARSVPRQAVQSDHTPWWMDAEALATSDDVREQRNKYKSPLLSASLRVGIVASSTARALPSFMQTRRATGARRGRQPSRPWFSRPRPRLRRQHNPKISH
ncbi:hypothetical protein [Amycolatopsis vastitatis]|uniref:hypothetical protein n=1 Tax=Amycolatopsis vastitatis TaxID=1905142 RepID=UPI001178B897|nr:hypothetical protein [Amycolatopsis vastitatis]